MTRYLLLIHDDAARWASLGDDQRAVHLGAYRALWEEMEQLGGYFVVECDLDTAVSYASRIPSAATGTIEVRRIGAEG